MRKRKSPCRQLMFHNLQRTWWRVVYVGSSPCVRAPSPFSDFGKCSFSSSLICACFTKTNVLFDPLNRYSTSSTQHRSPSITQMSSLKVSESEGVFQQTSGCQRGCFQGAYNRATQIQVILDQANPWSSCVVGTAFH